jgi:hypothetical protein
LVNYKTHGKALPLVMICGRGPFFSFMKTNFSVEFMEAIRTGENPRVDSVVEVFPKLPSMGAHFGLNLL